MSRVVANKRTRDGRLHQMATVTDCGIVLPMKMHRCTECGTLFYSTRSHAKTDSVKCRKARQRRLQREARERMQQTRDGLRQLRFSLD